MQSQGFIICSLNGSFYGIEASAVQEIFYLPELTPVVEAPDDIVGILNLRGEILPVMDLNIRLGQPPQDYRINDSAVIISWEGTRIGVIVNEVHEVQNLSTSDIKTNISYGREVNFKKKSRQSEASAQQKFSTSNFVAGVVQVEQNLVMLLNHQSLIEYSEAIQEETSNGHHSNQFDVTQLYDGNGNGKVLGMRDAFYGKPLRDRAFCPNATPEEKEIFRTRAENLRRSAEDEDLTGQMPLAVVGLNGEYFGLDLDIVREFTDIGKITPIPCCPSHVVGNINLRGEIVTLIDIRGILNLPATSVSTASKAMVVRIDDLVAGITVDRVYDVMYLNPSEMMPVPAAVHSMNDEYLRGTASYQEKMMAILELPKILTKGGLTVDEEV